LEAPLLVLLVGGAGSGFPGASGSGFRGRTADKAADKPATCDWAAADESARSRISGSSEEVDSSRGTSCC
jgi:hypothetical protein